MNIVAPISLILLSVAVSACQRINDTAADAPATIAKQSPVLTDSHSSIGKPSAPIDVSFQLQNAPVLSEPLTITFTLKPLIAGQNLTLNYTLTAGLTSLDSVTSTAFSTPAAGQELKHTISILPQQEGMMYVNVFISLQDNAGQIQSRALMIPISVGDISKQQPSHPNKSYIRQDPQGNPIIILPAEEPHK